MNRIAFSTDKENWHLDFGSIYDILCEEGRCQVGETFYTTEFKKVQASDILRSRYSLNKMYEIVDFVSESIADDLDNEYSRIASIFDDSKADEASTELQDFLCQWVDKYCDLNYYRMDTACGIQECKIEQEDIDGHDC
jgi:hypothetical protein